MTKRFTKSQYQAEKLSELQTRISKLEEAITLVKQSLTQLDELADMSVVELSLLVEDMASIVNPPNQPNKNLGSKTKKEIRKTIKSDE